MRRQALFLVAAVSFYFSTTAQRTPYFPKVSLIRTYDVGDLNKTFRTTSAISKEELKPSTTLIHAPLSPQLKLKDRYPLRYLWIKKRNKEGEDMFDRWMEDIRHKIIFTPGCGTHPPLWYDSESY